MILRLLFIFTFLGITISFCPNVPAAEVKVEGKLEVVPFNIQGLVVGTKLKFDQKYMEKYKVEVLAPFEFIAPKTKDVKVFAAWPPKTGGGYVKLSFAGPDKKLIENLQFVKMTIPMADLEKRAAITAEILAKQGMPTAFKGFKDPKYLGARQTKFKKYDGVEVAGTYVDPTIGPMIVWMVGILNPDSVNCIVAIANFNPSLSEVKSPADLGKTGIAAKAISTFKYIKP
jgi:hypothetical protein